MTHTRARRFDGHLHHLRSELARPVRRSSCRVNLTIQRVRLVAE